MTIVGFLLAALLSADPAPVAESTDDVRAAVERWIRQLDAASLADRSRAERELLDLGPKILPLLPPKDLLRSVSAREGVQRIRIQLQRRFARDSSRPSRVTLSGDFELNGLLTEITKQTGNPLQLGEDVPASAKVLRTWKLDDAIFWEAIDDICRETKLVPSSRPEIEGLILAANPASRESPAVCHAGVLRAELHEAIRQPVTGDSRRTLIRLRGELAFEPRLRPLFVHFQAGDFSAIDADGEAIENWNPLARYELAMAGASRRTKLNWDFVAPTDSVPESLSMKGRVLVQLAAATEPIPFDQLTTKQEILRRRGGVSVRLHHTEFAPTDGGMNSAKVKITVSYDAGGPAFESHRTWVYHNAAWLEDGKRRIPFADFETLMQTDGSVQSEYRFPDVPDARTLKFVYEAPTLLLDVPFDVEFNGIELKR